MFYMNIFMMKIFLSKKIAIISETIRGRNHDDDTNYKI